MKIKWTITSAMVYFWILSLCYCSIVFLYFILSLECFKEIYLQFSLKISVVYISSMFYGITSSTFILWYTVPLLTQTLFIIAPLKRLFRYFFLIAPPWNFIIIDILYIYLCTYVYLCFMYKNICFFASQEPFSSILEVICPC